ncbi:MAG: AMP-binding protein [Candidatus Omnitrophota bacterium]|nr:AMP-binding protein [Candidatus Omnitrophota bacterium]
MQTQALLEDKFQKFGNKPAIIFQDQAISFAELKTRVFKLAAGLQALGVKKGDRVAIFLPNWPEYIYSYLSLFTLGTIVVPLDFMLTDEEVTNFLNHSESSVLIAKEKKGVDFKQIKNKCPWLKKIVLLKEEGSSSIQEEGFVSWQDLANSTANFIAEEISETDYSSIFYTSGSTGHPKGVLLTYAHQDNPIICLRHFIQPNDKDSFLNGGLPFSHVAGLDYMLFMLNFGATLVLMERFHPLEFLRNLEKYKVTIFCIVPAMFVAILSLKECEKFDLSALHYPVVFGAPSSPDLLRKFQQLCPNANLLNGWGMTETAAPNTLSPPDITKINSIGPFGAGMEAKIVDDNSKTLSVGEKGELWVKGKAVMVGYYKEKELTDEVLTVDGWLKTGDIAMFDKAGLFYIVGRKKEMIKVSGEIVYAPEVEEALYKNPAVAEAAVIGVPDEVRGEAVKAFIVLKSGASLDQDGVRYFLRSHLAHFKIPHEVEFRQNLPKNRTGKIDKELLKR